MEFIPEFDCFQNQALKIRHNSEPRNNLGASLLIDLGFSSLFSFFCVFFFFSYFASASYLREDDCLFRLFTVAFIVNGKTIHAIE